MNAALYFSLDQMAQASRESKEAIRTDWKADDFRGKFNVKVPEGGDRRHRLSCEVVAYIVNISGGCTQSQVNKLRELLSSLANCHKGFKKVDNNKDREADEKMIKAHKENKEVKLTQAQIRHIQQGIKFMTIYRKYFDPLFVSEANGMYAKVCDMDGHPALDFYELHVALERPW